jgi:aminodeoxyfutalosine synthase
MGTTDAMHTAIHNLRPLTLDEGMELFTKTPLATLQQLADARRRQFHGDTVFYNQNIHIEPTNKCVFACKFCAFYRKPKATEADGAWDYSLDDIDAIMDRYRDIALTEVHVTGGVHPTKTLDWWCELIRRVKAKRPEVHVKAYTAIEIAWMAKQAKLSFRDTVQQLIDAGLGSLPCWRKSAGEQLAGDPSDCA